MSCVISPGIKPDRAEKRARVLKGVRVHSGKGWGMEREGELSDFIAEQYESNCLANSRSDVLSGMVAYRCDKDSSQ